MSITHNISDLYEFDDFSDNILTENSYSLDDEDSPTFLPDDFLLDRIKKIEPKAVQIASYNLTFINFKVLLDDGKLKNLTLSEQQREDIFSEVIGIKKSRDRRSKLRKLGI